MAMTARDLLARGRLEARYAATMARAVGPQAVRGNPLRYLGVATAAWQHGVAGAGTAAAAAMNPHGVAIVDDRGSLTSAELHRRSTALAAALYATGVDAGSSIGILCRNHREFFEVFFAASKLGARTLLLNTDFSAPQLTEVCGREGVDVLVHDGEFADRTTLLDPSVRRLVAHREAGDPDDAAATDTLIRHADPRVLPRPRRAQRVVLLTSGTTGTPKGAPRDIDATLAAPGGVLSRIPLRPGRTVVVAAPLFHAWGLSMAMLSFGLGSTVVVSRRFDAAATLAAMAERRADTLITLPVLLGRLVAAVEASDRPPRLQHLRVIALSGSALRPELAERATRAFGPVVHNLYGSTEVAAVAIATPQDLAAAPGTVGRPPFGTVVRILDDRDRPVRHGAVGRIFVRSSMQFGGYTGGGSKRVVDGFMSTGDLGHLDRDGRLHVEGRDDDMIVSGGENVFPLEVENLLATHPSVREAAVVGVPDEEFGARLAAFVVVDGPITADAVRDLVRQNLARYKVPRDVIFVDELPRNPAGKVVKRLLDT